MNSVLLKKDTIYPYKVIEDYQNKNCNLDKSGGESIFIGYMRKSSEQENDIISMKLDYYPDMTEKYLINLQNNVNKKYNLHNSLIVHRVGNVYPGECLVIVACWSKHRKQCLDAVQFILEDLKYRAPLWKKESFQDGSSIWVEKNT
tara:strand:+ start:2494 stop:2931 length:438 start_codon:yes stop_codon:yes gene_type:complete